MRDFHFEASKSEAVCDSGCLSWKTARGRILYRCLLTPKMFESMQDKVREKLETTLRTFE